MILGSPAFNGKQDFLLPRYYNQPGYHSEQGVAIFELALILPLLLLLVVGMWDLSLVMRENVILSEAVRAGLRTIVTSSPFENNRYFGDLDTQQREYATKRYEAAIRIARYVIERNRLNDSHYVYNVYDVLRTDPATGRTDPTVQVNISLDPTASRFVLAPNVIYQTCVGGSTFVPGVFVGPGFNVSEPSFNSSCNP